MLPLVARILVNVQFVANHNAFALLLISFLVLNLSASTNYCLNHYSRTSEETAKSEMAAQNKEPGNGLKIDNLKANESSFYNVSVITHPRFLVAVPTQFHCNALSRANRIANRLLNSSGASHLSVIASSPTHAGDILYLSLAVLIVIGFIGCSVTRAVQRNYTALLWFQPIYGALIFILLWAGRNLWQPQHIVLSKDTGMLHSRRNSFVTATEIPLSSIRFFRKTALFRPRFAKQSVRYGIEAVTTGSCFLFAFSNSEQIAVRLEDALNRSLWSFQVSTPPSTITGNVGTSAVTVVLSKQDIPDVENLPRDSEMRYHEEIRCVGFKMSRKWVLKSIYSTSTLFLVWILSLAISLSTGEAAVNELRHSRSALLGTFFYLLVIAIFILLQITRVTWKISADEDDRSFVCRTLSSDQFLHVDQYKSIKLERKESKMLSFFQKNHKFGIEQIGGMRYSVLMVSREDGKSVRLVGDLSEGETMFMISRIGRMFPWLFENVECSPSV